MCGPAIGSRLIRAARPNFFLSFLRRVYSLSAFQASTASGYVSVIVKQHNLAFRRLRTVSAAPSPAAPGFAAPSEQLESSAAWSANSISSTISSLAGARNESTPGSTRQSLRQAAPVAACRFDTRAQSLAIAARAFELQVQPVVAPFASLPSKVLWTSERAHDLVGPTVIAEVGEGGPGAALVGGAVRRGRLSNVLFPHSRTRCSTAGSVHDPRHGSWRENVFQPSLLKSYSLTLQPLRSKLNPARLGWVASRKPLPGCEKTGKSLRPTVTMMSGRPSPSWYEVGPMLEIADHHR